MAEVTPDDVTGLLEADASSPGAVIPIITTMARAYTRGRGFDIYGAPNDDVAAVITTASARLVANSHQVSAVDTVGPFARDLRSFFTGWTLAELSVLNRYRVTAM